MTAFLDINITRQNNQLKTSVYRKPTFSGVFTRYESYIDQSYKKSLIFTLLSRCYSIFSDYTLFHSEVEKLRETFKKNSYPSGIIELSIRTFLNRLYVPNQIYSTSPKKELLIISPFLGTMSSNLKWKLQTSIRNQLSFNDFSILYCENNAFKPSLRESILIKRDSPELNRNVSSMPRLLFN